jgi:hypothetical protein
MRQMNLGDTYFFVLYLVNVFQPITKKDLFGEVAKVAGTSPSESLDLFSASEALKELIKRGLVIEHRGTFSCSVVGNQRAAKLGLRKARDKNRLFFLKNSLRRDYNEDR